MSEALRNAARDVFATALQAVDVRAAVQEQITQQNDLLILAGKTLRVSELDRILIIAMGKAAIPMYTAAAEMLSGLVVTAVVVAPQETLPLGAGSVPLEDGSSAVFLPGSHPTPTADALQAADRILALLRTVTPDTAVLFLISGGASAMVEKPLSPDISLDDLAVFTRGLVGSGMSITGMNTLRKHLSAVKGGRLAVAAAAARMQCTLLISDVPHAAPDAVASGPSLPDGASTAEAHLLFEALKSSTPLPAPVIQWFESVDLPATPKQIDAAFARSHWKVILSSSHLEQAAVAAAQSLGFHAVVDNTCDDWDYREAGRYLLDRSSRLGADLRQPTCLISVGEIGVTLSANPGEGGRNQQFALWCAQTIAKDRLTATVLSGGSDGIDGHSFAAGAVCDETSVARAADAGFSVQEALDRFNTAPVVRAIADDLITGPTGNNLRDLRLVLTE